MANTYALGRIGLRTCGEYNATKTYQSLDVVNYNGSSYVARETVTGIVPTNEESWDLMASGFPAEIGTITDLYRFGIQCGQSAKLSLPGNEYLDVTIQFPISYLSGTKPIVIPVLWSGSTGVSMGNVTVSAYTTSNTQVVVRCFNNSSSDRAPRINWIAIGIPDPSLVS